MHTRPEAPTRPEIPGGRPGTRPAARRRRGTNGDTYHGTARHGTARHGTARHGSARHGAEHYDAICVTECPTDLTDETRGASSGYLLSRPGSGAGHNRARAAPGVAAPAEGDERHLSAGFVLAVVGHRTRRNSKRDAESRSPENLASEDDHICTTLMCKSSSEDTLEHTLRNTDKQRFGSPQEKR